MSQSSQPHPEPQQKYYKASYTGSHILCSMPTSHTEIHAYLQNCKVAMMWADDAILVYTNNWTIGPDGKVSKSGFINVRTGKVYHTQEDLDNEVLHLMD
jgi:hypothetical protein